MILQELVSASTYFTTSFEIIKYFFTLQREMSFVVYTEFSNERICSVSFGVGTKINISLLPKDLFRLTVYTKI